MGNFKYSLEICSKEELGRVFELNRSEVIIGRGPVDIAIDNPTLSANHCLVQNDGTRLTVIDLQSKNGTLVNNSRISAKTVLSSGDILSLGNVSFRVTTTTGKERLSSYVAPIVDAKQSILKKLLARFSSNIKKVTTFERMSKNLVLVLYILVWIIMVFPLYFIMEEKVAQSRIERACSLVYSLAVSNTEAMRQKQPSMVDVNIVAKEVGIIQAIVLTNEGIVWAPEALLNKKVADVYGENARDTEKLLVQERGDGNLDIALPVKYYDSQSGKSAKLGVARIIYDIKMVESGPHWLLIVGICSIVYLAVLVIFHRFLAGAVKKDLQVFQEDCEDVIKGNSSFLEEKYAPEFNRLTVTFNRVLRKIGKNATSVTSESVQVDSGQIAEMICFIDQPAMLVNSMNVVVCCNDNASKYLQLNNDEIVGKSFFEIQCKRDYFQDLLEFVCEATQKNSKQIAALTTSMGDKRLVSFPVAIGFKMILMS